MSEERVLGGMKFRAVSLFKMAYNVQGFLSVPEFEKQMLKIYSNLQ